MMVVVGSMRSAGTLHILLQSGKGTLRAGDIARLQRSLERLKIVPERAVLAGRTARRSRRLGRVWLVLLQGCEGLLSAREVARLESGLEGFEVLRLLFEAALDAGLVLGRSRVYTCYVHNDSINRY